MRFLRRSVWMMEQWGGYYPHRELRGIGIRGNGNRERDVCGVSSASASGHIMVTR